MDVLLMNFCGWLARQEQDDIKGIRYLLEDLKKLNYKNKSVLNLLGAYQIFFEDR
jgi:hypothetical protein